MFSLVERMKTQTKLAIKMFVLIYISDILLRFFCINLQYISDNDVSYHRVYLLHHWLNVVLIW